MSGRSIRMLRRLTSVCLACALVFVWTTTATAVDARAEALTALSKRLNASRVKLKTWTGSYRLKQTAYQENPRINENNPQVGPDPALNEQQQKLTELTGKWFRDLDAVVDFSIDFQTSNLHSHWRSVSPAVFRSMRTTEVRVEAGKPIEFISIVNQKDFLFLDCNSQADLVRDTRPSSKSAGKARVRSVRLALENKRSAAADLFEYGTVFNPATLFQVGGWLPEQSLQLYADKIAKGKPSPLEIRRDSKDRDVTIVTMTYGGINNGHLIAETHYRDFGTDVSVVEQCAFYYGARKERPDGLLRWKWKADNGIWVPKTYSDAQYNNAENRLQIERSLELVSSSVNPDIDSRVFAIDGLGLRDGDLVRNPDSGEVRVMSASGLRGPGKLAAQAKISASRSPLLIFNAFVVLVVACWIVIRVLRRKRADP